MKTLTAYLLTLGLLFISFTAQARLNVFACEPEWAALTQEIGGDRVAVFSATSGKQDPHRIQARPGLIAKARRADVLICTGADLEAGWLPLLLNKSANGKILAGAPGHIMVSDHVELKDKPQRLDRSLGDIHAAGNPHIHLDPHNILRIANALAQRLSEIDTSQHDVYQANLLDFTRRWQAAMAQWHQQAAPIKGRAYAVDHTSWIYLAQWLEIDMDTIIEPRPGIPPGAEHLSQLVKTMDEKNIRKIIYAAHSNPRAALWLAEKTGARAIELPYTVGGNDRADNLFSLFDETLTLLLD